MLPNFLIIGAAKSGTTALYERLKLHPEIFLSDIKEPNFFVLKNSKYKFDKETINSSYLNSFVYNLKDYSSLFSEAERFKAIGEASPIYLYDKNAPLEIKNTIPDIKLIVILRNPIERAFSNFSMHLAGLGLETTNNFIEALELEDERIDKDWWWGFHYKNAGLYSEQLTRYFNIFKKDQILILTYDDFKINPDKIYLEITNFLGVRPYNNENINKYYKVSEATKIRWIEQILHNENFTTKIKNVIGRSKGKRIKDFIRRKNKYKPKITEREFNFLVSYFRKDIMKLENMIDKDLSNWLVYYK